MGTGPFFGEYIEDYYKAANVTPIKCWHVYCETMGDERAVFSVEDEYLQFVSDLTYDPERNGSDVIVEKGIFLSIEQLRKIIDVAQSNAE